MDGARQLAEILEAAGDERRSSFVRLILNRLSLPQAYVTVVGETSTGKSSLINALLAQDMLPVSGKPTTGIVTHIACRDEPEPRFFAIYRDATQGAIDYEQFRKLSVDPDDEILRLQVRAKPKASGHIGMHVFDTPGYNAVLSKHEEVLMTFLPQSDVIVFVVGYRTGFGQTDQDLFEAVAAATAHDKNIPLVLVVNRAPEDCGPGDKRVAEIRRLAEDGLKRSMSLQIIASTNRPAIDAPMARSVLAAHGLWDEVRKHAFDPVLLESVQGKLETTLLALLDETDAAFEREDAQLMASADEGIAISRAVDITREAKAASLREIGSTMASLETELPSRLEKLAAMAMKKVETDIQSSEKWLGYPDCAEWISGHCLPFEVRSIGRAIEEHLTIEMQALNRRLEEIANTAIVELDKTAALRMDDPVQRFAKSVSATLAQRLAGNAVNQMLLGLGGVGGAAAGAGNLAKMVVARVGRLFGKQFGREVYNQIGRIFSKKMLERLSVAVIVILEAVTFVYEAQVWQGNLIKRSRDAIKEWKDAVAKDIREEHLPSIRQANYDIIEALYDNMEGPATPDPEREKRLAEVQFCRQRLASLRQRLNSSINA
ncbi:dynamin family protein [Trinickia soli]|uniref:dynamin family protein n=1 Tax=Trinickia soli TaxID=380675 RepID=UPI003FA34ABD